jgi:hypothetical protein
MPREVIDLTERGFSKKPQINYSWHRTEQLPLGANTGTRGRCYRATLTSIFSPIKLMRVVSRKSGDSILRLGFYSAAYAAGAQNFVLELKVMVRAKSKMVSALQYAGISADKVRLLGRPENRHRPTKWRKVASHA